MLNILDRSPSTSNSKQETVNVQSVEVKEEKEKISPEKLKEIENKLLLVLDDATIELPIDVIDLHKLVAKHIPNETIPLTAVEDLVQKFTAQTAVKSV